MSYELQQSLGITPLNCCAAATSRPPQQAILDRPLDLVLIGTLRDRLALPGASPPGWHRAATDPVEGAAVTAIHNAPSRPWAVDTLAMRLRFPELPSPVRSGTPVHTLSALPSLASFTSDQPNIAR